MKYRINPGESFAMPDGSIKTGGEEIELDSDVAEAHKYRVRLVADEKPSEAAAATPPNPPGPLSGPGTPNA